MSAILTDEVVEVVSNAIEAAELKWKAESGGDDVSCVECPADVKARAALLAALTHIGEACARTAEGYDETMGRCRWEELNDAFNAGEREARSSIATAIRAATKGESNG